MCVGCYRYKPVCAVYYLRQVNQVNGEDNVFIGLRVYLSVCL